MKSLGYYERKEKEKCKLGIWVSSKLLLHKRNVRGISYSRGNQLFYSWHQQMYGENLCQPVGPTLHYKGRRKKKKIGIGIQRLLFSCRISQSSEGYPFFSLFPRSLVVKIQRKKAKPEGNKTLAFFPITISMVVNKLNAFISRRHQL